ncbi:MAG: hypothetical protein ACI3U8_01445 [Candidatus Onthomonas sp.]
MSFSNSLHFVSKGGLFFLVSTEYTGIEVTDAYARLAREQITRKLSEADTANTSQIA